jgi:hypothetical protein
MPSCVNAATGTASIWVSTAPQIAMSASPRTMCRHASAMAAEPEASAISGEMIPALAWRSSPTAAAGPLGMYICTVSGDTARRPFSRQASCWTGISSVEPSASPIDTTSRLVSTSGDPALLQTRRLSTVDIFCMYDVRRRSTRSSCSSKVSTSCPPMRTGESNSATNGLSSTRMPLRASSRSFHVSSASEATGVVDATAVTTTSTNPSPVLNGAMPAEFLLVS